MTTVIVVDVVPLNDSDKPSATISVEGKRSEGWSREKTWDIVPGERDALRRVLLSDTQRLVIEGHAGVEVVYDRDQAAAVPRRVDAPARPVDPDESLADRAVREDEERRQAALREARKTAPASTPTTVAKPIIPPAGTPPVPPTKPVVPPPSPPPVQPKDSKP